MTTATSRALNPTIRVALSKNKPDSVAFLLYVSLILSNISSLLSGHIKSVGFRLRKISSFLRPIKDDVGQTCHKINTRLKEHHWHIQLEHVDK
jgi:hypothetical protein